MLVNLPCDLCNAHDEDFLYFKTGVLTKQEFRVVRCKQCGFIYINPRLDEGSIGDLYNEDYYNGNGFDSYVNYLEEFNKPGKAKLFRPDLTIDLIKALSPPPARILDFGCGIGDVMKEAVQMGYDCEGFDVSPYASEFLRAQGYRVFRNTEDLPPNSYDVIVAVEVLEHAFSPTSVLNSVHKALKFGGLFYYTTLNFDNYFNGRKRDMRDSYIVPEGHINSFSTSTMLQFFEKAKSSILQNSSAIFLTPPAVPNNSVS